MNHQRGNKGILKKKINIATFLFGLSYFTIDKMENKLQKSLVV